MILRMKRQFHRNKFNQLLKRRFQSRVLKSLKFEQNQFNLLQRWTLKFLQSKCKAQQGINNVGGSLDHLIMLNYGVGG
jgi:hypothetical protein